MSYLIHAGLLLAACFVYYWLLLRSETHFQLNRWVLLGCLAGSLLLPLVTVPAAWSLQNVLASEEVETSPAKEEISTALATDIAAESTAGIDATVLEKTTAEKAVEETEQTANVAKAEETTLSAKTNIQKAAPPVDWWKVLRWVYLAGLLVFGLNFLVQFGQLVLRLIRYPGYDLGQYRLVEMSEDAAPYSFWNRIFLNPERYDPDTFHQIFQHEQIHVKQKHSIDLLLAELLIVFQWFNPFAWLYRAAIEHNLEFLTDAEMLRIGNDPECYQLSLVKVAVPNFPNGLVASYNQNFLEKRITMMKTKKSSVRSGWKYLSLLPLLLVSVLQFNAVAQSPVVPATPVPPAPATSIVALTPPSASVSTPAPAAAPISLPVPAQAVSPADVFSPVPIAAPAPTPVPAAVASPNSVPLEVHIPVARFSNDYVAKMNTKMNKKYGMETGLNSWTAIIEGAEICFQFMSRSRESNNRYHWNSSRCFEKSEFGELPRGQMGEFYLTRASGKMTLKGVFDGNDGVGNFSFEPRPSFVADLDRLGYGTYEENELLLLFMADMNDDYLRFLKDQGYTPSHQKLLELAIFYEDLDELKERISTVERLGYGKPSLKKLIELQIHGVNEKYIADLASAGFDDLGLNDVLKAKIHGLSSDFVKEMNQMGFSNLSFDRLTELAIHGISTEYVQELRDLGFSNLDPKEVLQSKIHGVSTERIADFQKAGFNDLTLDQAQKLAIHGVSAKYVAELRDLGYTNLSPGEVVQSKIHGVSTKRIADWQKAGFSNLSLDEAKKMAIHGVDADLVASLKDFGFTNLTVDEVVGAKIHGMSPQRIKAMKDTGMDISDLKKLQGAFIHGVDADQINGFRKLGYNDMDLSDFTTARIHGVTPRFAGSFEEVGFKDIPFKTLVKLRIHGVSANFIKERLKDGRDLNDYIKMKIHGL